MLELKEYTLQELSAMLHTNGKQATDRKLQTYGIDFTVKGRDRNPAYTITAISNPFKVYCVFDLGFDPHTDFKKLRDFISYLLKDADFQWRPMEMMEEYLAIEGRSISRQTIAKYIEKLRKLEVININGEPVFYKVYKENGVQQHKLITKEEYCAAWRVYWEERRNGYESSYAFTCMYSYLNGIPRKQHKIEANVFYSDLLDTLSSLVADDYLSEKNE